jgi:hypothetical protein
MTVEMSVAAEDLSGSPKGPASLSGWDLLAVTALLLASVAISHMGVYAGADLYVIWGGAIIGALFGAWLVKVYLVASMHGRRKADLYVSGLLFIVGSAIGGVCTVGGIPYVMDAVSRKDSDRERAEFLAAPGEAGFSALTSMALRDFQVQLALAGEHGTWLRTSVKASGSGSAASVVPGPGYCELYFRPSRLSDGMRFNSPDRVLGQLWIRGVLLHELAHCVDWQRDYRQMTALGRDVGLAALSPWSRQHVVDVIDHEKAATTDDSRLWKEAFADIFAIGWWRLSADANQWPELARALRESRVQAGAIDPLHETSCWIDLAMKAKPPATLNGLTAWADGLREKSQCAGPLRALATGRLRATASQ